MPDVPRFTERCRDIERRLAYLELDPYAPLTRTRGAVQAIGRAWLAAVDQQDGDYPPYVRTGQPTGCTVTVTGCFGNPLAGMVVRSTLGSATTDGDGRASFVVPFGANPGAELIDPDGRYTSQSFSLSGSYIDRAMTPAPGYACVRGCDRPVPYAGVTISDPFASVTTDGFGGACHEQGSGTVYPRQSFTNPGTPADGNFAINYGLNGGTLSLGVIVTSGTQVGDPTWPVSIVDKPCGSGAISNLTMIAPASVTSCDPFAATFDFSADPNAALVFQSGPATVNVSE